ncbi:GNAT family acetyltransferase [Isoptericola sp. F-RaC21]|uniref:GNAT family acetyltransferase n=1 Tax=Isoptericola sp. F-RaC21 TaxID=3141452 RepID=UPI00315B5302
MSGSPVEPAETLVVSTGSTDVAFREIADDDVEQVVALWEACGLTRPWNDPRLDIADARANPTSTVLVGVGEGGVVASAVVGYDGHRGWIYYVAVDPREQGSGLGRAAVAAAEGWLRAAGARKVQLMVRATNAQVVGFYDRLGYADQETVVLGKWFDGSR